MNSRGDGGHGEARIGRSRPDSAAGGEMLDLRVEGPAHGGTCVARHDGRVVFVRGSLPGERVYARVTRARSSYLHADLVDVLEPSPGRVEACPDVARGGGCCDLSHATIDLQRDVKRRVAADLLARIGRLDIPPPPGDPAGDAPRGADADTGVAVREPDAWRESLPLVALPVPGAASAGGADDGRHWRTRARLGVDAAGRPAAHRHRAGGLLSGPRCTQFVPALLDDLPSGPDGFVPGGDLVVLRDDTGVRHVVELLPAADGPVRRGNPRDGRARAASRRAAQAGRRERRVLAGGGLATMVTDDRRWTIPAGGFWQAHPGAAVYYRRLVAGWALRYGGLRAGESVWDLYGGVGVLGSALAPVVGGRGRIDVIEADRDVIAVAAVAVADLPSMRVTRGLVPRDLERLGADPALVILDPPRAGAGVTTIAAIAATPARCVIHVGCDPAAFARDLRDLSAHGFAVRDVEVVDAFPGSHHMECLAVAVRARRAGAVAGGAGRSA